MTGNTSKKKQGAAAAAVSKPELSIEADEHLAANNFNVESKQTRRLSVKEYYESLLKWTAIQNDDKLTGEQKLYNFLAGNIQSKLVFFAEFLREKVTDSKTNKKPMPSIEDMQNIFYYGLHVCRTLINNHDMNIIIKPEGGPNIITLGKKVLSTNVVIVDVLNWFYDVRPEMLGDTKKPQEKQRAMNKFRIDNYKLLSIISQKSGIMFICVRNEWDVSNFKLLNIMYEGVIEINTKYNIKEIRCIPDSDRAQYTGTTISEDEYYNQPYKYVVTSWGGCDYDVKIRFFKVIRNTTVKLAYGFNSTDDIAISMLWWLLYVNGYNVSILSNDNFGWLRMQQVNNKDIGVKFGYDVNIPDTFADENSRIKRTKIINYLQSIMEDEQLFKEVIELCKIGMANIDKTSQLLIGKGKGKAVDGNEFGSGAEAGNESFTMGSMSGGKLYKRTLKNRMQVRRVKRVSMKQK